MVCGVSPWQAPAQSAFLRHGKCSGGPWDRPYPDFGCRGAVPAVGCTGGVPLFQGNVVGWAGWEDGVGYLGRRLNQASLFEQQALIDAREVFRWR